MKLIPNFADLLHKVKLPRPEKCFLIELGDEEYIEKWIKNGETACELEELFEWINTKYKLKKEHLTHEERKIAEEVKKRFLLEQWCLNKIFSDHQRKYRYYKKAIEDLKSRTKPPMNEQATTTISSLEWSIYT